MNSCEESDAYDLRYAAPAGPLSDEKQLVLNRIEPGSRVLEIGAHTGSFSAVLTARGCRVTAVEVNPVAAARIATYAERVIVGNIERPEVQNCIHGQFDTVLLMHVLEHLSEPWSVLRALTTRLVANGRLLVLLPNVAAWRVRKELFFKGTFEYEDVGLLDRTHLRFFTVPSGRALIESAGLRVIEWRPAHVCVPLERRLRISTGSTRLASLWARWLTQRYPNLTTEIAFFEAQRREPR
jgi:SAM-dependent methyltransferase